MDRDATRWTPSDRLTPARCRQLAAILLGAGFVLHLLYLLINPPLDLSGDEAHYWDWSRQLDWGYYSKGPLVAWVIALGTSLFGHEMWAVRLPALVLAVGSGAMTYWLTRKLFDSDRLALGALLLCHTVPAFIAGSLVMTIDPPFYFCWAAATCLATLAIFDHKRWAWPLVGLFVGLGFLAKFAMPLWMLGLLVFLLVDRDARPHLRRPGPYVMLLVFAICTLPVVYFNVQNDWVSFRHVAQQTNSEAGAWTDYLLFPLKMLGAQAGIVGPVLFVFMGCAALSALRGTDRGARYLLCIGGVFFAVVFVRSFGLDIEPNWPAPAYFTALILAAWWLAPRLPRLRNWLIAQIIFGLIVGALVHRLDLLYPPMQALGVPPTRFDPTFRLRGHEEFADAVERALAKLPPDAIVLARDYQMASLMAFYVEGHPRTFNVASYRRGPERARWNQFDLWPDRQLDDPRLLGRSAVYVGQLDQGGALRDAFESLEQFEEVRIERHGVFVRRMEIWIGHGFRGMRREGGAGRY